MKILESKLFIEKEDKRLLDPDKELCLIFGFDRIKRKRIAHRRLITTTYYPRGYKGAGGLPDNPHYITNVLERTIYATNAGLLLWEHQTHSFSGTQSQQYITYSFEAAIKWLQGLKEVKVETPN